MPETPSDLPRPTQPATQPSSHADTRQVQSFPEVPDSATVAVGTMEETCEGRAHRTPAQSIGTNQLTAPPTAYTFLTAHGPASLSAQPGV